MAEVFGAVAAGIALCGQLIRISRSIQKATKRVRHARQNISNLADETIIFAGLYRRFLSTCEDNVEEYSNTASSIKRLGSWTRSTIRSLRELLRKVRALASDPRYHYSIFESFTAHLEWFRSKSAVEFLRTSLGVTRECMSGFNNLMYIKKLGDELDLLKAALTNDRERRVLEETLGLPLEEKIEMLEQQIHIAHTAHSTNQRILHNAREKLVTQRQKVHTIDSVPKADALLHFAESVERYAEKVLPLTQSSKRIHKPIRSYPSNSNSRRAYSERRPSTNTSINTLPTPLSPGPRTRSKISTPSALSSLYSSNHSSGLSQRPTIIPSSTSTLSPVTSKVVRTSSNGRSASMNTAQDNQGQANVGDNAELTGSPKEYINDPNGTILSPLKVQPRSSWPSSGPSTQRSSRQRSERVGQHTIMIDQGCVYLNSHFFLFENDRVAKAFFQALMTNADKLDALNQGLAERHREQRVWYGVPGWAITLRGTYSPHIAHYQPARIGG